MGTVPASVFLNNISNSARFVVLMSTGAYRHGYDSIRIDQTGGCYYLKNRRKPTLCESARFAVDQKVVDALKTVLVKSDFFKLKGQLTGSIQDGPQRWIEVRVNEDLKKVHCDG